MIETNLYPKLLLTIQKKTEKRLVVYDKNAVALYTAAEAHVFCHVVSKDGPHILILS